MPSRVDHCNPKEDLSLSFCVMAEDTSGPSQRGQVHQEKEKVVKGLNLLSIIAVKSVHTSELVILFFAFLQKDKVMEHWLIRFRRRRRLQKLQGRKPLKEMEIVVR